jgi:hypothetical protein
MIAVISDLHMEEEASDAIPAEAHIGSQQTHPYG